MLFLVKMQIMHGYDHQFEKFWYRVNLSWCTLT